MPGTLKVVELNRLGRAGFCIHGGYNLLVNVVMKVVAGIFREATMRTSLDWEVRKGPNRMQQKHAYQIQRMPYQSVSSICKFVCT